MVAWKSSKVVVKVLRYHFQFIHVQIKLDGEEEFLFTPVYASPRIEGRKELWNDIAQASEKRGGKPASRKKCATFNNIINDC